MYGGGDIHHEVLRLFNNLVQYQNKMWEYTSTKWVDSTPHCMLILLQVLSRSIFIGSLLIHSACIPRGPGGPSRPVSPFSPCLPSRPSRPGTPSRPSLPRGPWTVYKLDVVIELPLVVLSCRAVAGWRKHLRMQRHYWGCQSLCMYQLELKWSSMVTHCNVHSTYWTYFVHPKFTHRENIPAVVLQYKAVKNTTVSLRSISLLQNPYSFDLWYCVLQLMYNHAVFFPFIGNPVYKELRK